MVHLYSSWTHLSKSTLKRTVKQLKSQQKQELHIPGPSTLPLSYLCTYMRGKNSFPAESTRQDEYKQTFQSGQSFSTPLFISSIPYSHVSLY